MHVGADVRWSRNQTSPLNQGATARSRTHRKRDPDAREVFYRDGLLEDTEECPELAYRRAVRASTRVSRSVDLDKDAAQSSNSVLVAWRGGVAHKIRARRTDLTRYRCQFLEVRLQRRRALRVGWIHRRLLLRRLRRDWSRRAAWRAAQPDPAVASPTWTSCARRSSAWSTRAESTT
jgi:hypothetical protein